MKNGRHKWKRGKLRTEFEVVRDLLAEFTFCQVVKGWIPESLSVAADHRFRFVHIDVDLATSRRGTACNTSIPG